MNILYILQQSIYNNVGKWLTADSNIQMMRGIISELLEKKQDWHFYILIGRLEDFADITSYSEIIDNERVHFISYNFPVDAFLNRQHFNCIEFDEMFKKLPKIDIVWNNITELSRNIKTYLYYKKYNAKLITTCFWLDAPLIGQEKVPQSISYDWRQFDGFECSDLVVFTCQSTKDAWEYNAQLKFKCKIGDILSKSTIWDFGFSAKELNKTENDHYNKFDKKTILFLNRLSGINYTHHEEFIEALKILKTIRDDWQVIFTNPSQKISWQTLKETVPNIFIPCTQYDRKTYKQLLWTGDISVHLYDTELYGGCAHREAIYCDNIVITPQVYEYKRIQGNNYPFYISEITPKEIAKKLNIALINLNYFSMGEVKKRNYESSFEYISDTVIKSIEGIL